MELTISIPNYHRVGSGKSAFVLYRIEVTVGDFTHAFEKRYSDFHKLHRVMKLMSRVVNDVLPHFPGQKVFKQLLGPLSGEDIKERRASLEVYMRSLCNTLSARSSHYFADFLEVPSAVYKGWLSQTQDY